MSTEAQIQTDLQILPEFPPECVSLVIDLAIDVLVDPKNLERGMIYILRRAMQRGTTDSKLSQELLDLNLSQDISAFIVSKWKDSRGRVASAVVNRTMSANQLVDLEWRFGVTAASDDLDQVGNSYLQMRLVFEVGQGQVQEVIMELSLNQFYTFVAELENAKSIIAQLSTASV